MGASAENRARTGTADCDDRPVEPLSVRLRPFEEGDLWFFDRVATDRQFTEPFEWGGFTSAESWRRRWREDGLLGSSPFCLAITTVEDDSLIGVVDWRQNDRPGAGVWEIGVVIMPEHRGRGVGTAAQRQLVDYLFSTTPCHRVWAGTEVENIAEQRAIERAGLRREGCLRGHHFRDGEWRDSYIYGIIRDDRGT
jgi:ribosomal-protein-alanine N-acetyltransferase